MLPTAVVTCADEIAYMAIEEEVYAAMPVLLAAAEEVCTAAPAALKAAQQYWLGEAASIGRLAAAARREYDAIKTHSRQQRPSGPPRRPEQGTPGQILPQQDAAGGGPAAAATAAAPSPREGVLNVGADSALPSAGSLNCEGVEAQQAEEHQQQPEQETEGGASDRWATIERLQPLLKQTDNEVVALQAGMLLLLLLKAEVEGRVTGEQQRLLAAALKKLKGRMRDMHKLMGGEEGGGNDSEEGHNEQEG